MCVEDQTSTVAFLADPKTYGEQLSDLVTIETHISLVFLAGNRAFKLKRAVRLPYLDFSTADLRLSACLREVELNKRTAPTLYRAARRITLEANGSLVFDGQGALVDAVVEMARFDERTLFDRMAARGQLTALLLTETAGTLAHFHAGAAVDHSRKGSAIISNVITINEQAFATTQLFASDAVASLDGAFRSALSSHLKLLDVREKAGKVRRCHGDLHLRNICLLDGAPTLFDCIEFDEAIATIDVLYDLAFLVMDLWHLGVKSAANLILNRYLDETDENDGLPLLPLFMALRSAIRAHVIATQGDEAGTCDREQLDQQAKTYFELSKQLLAPVPARLIAIGGLSGSGKSAIAAAIADQIGPPPGARILSSDRIRKRLHGVRAETRLPAEAYRAEISERVYAIQSEEAGAILRNGHAVIADAVFDRRSDRKKIEQCAAVASVPFVGLWLDAPMDTLLARVDARRGDPSDATTEIVRAQGDHRHDRIDWIRVPANGDLASTAARIVEILSVERST
jgi:aminoglycoside phosphotransferase family enzyme/predicted kinase